MKYNYKIKNTISESRLKKLNLIDENELQIVKELLLKSKYSSYQEKNIDRIREYMIKN